MTSETKLKSKEENCEFKYWAKPGRIDNNRAKEIQSKLLTTYTR